MTNMPVVKTPEAAHETVSEKGETVLEGHDTLPVAPKEIVEQQRLRTQVPSSTPEQQSIWRRVLKSGALGATIGTLFSVATSGFAPLAILRSAAMFGSISASVPFLQKALDRVFDGPSTKR